MSYADTITADLRLVMLRILADPETPNYTLNSSILHKLMKEKTGYQVARDKACTELCWLKEQGLVTLKEGEGFYIATLTSRGLDVATGAAVVPGVDRPSPRSR